MRERVPEWRSGSAWCTLNAGPVEPTEFAGSAINRTIFPGGMHHMSLRALSCMAACLTTALACATRAPRELPSPPGLQASLAVMTFNIRYAHTQPPNLWPDRLPAILEVIRHAAPDLVGTQEGLYHQLRDLERTMPGYGWIGLGRDGGSRGEFMAVYYRRSRLEPLEYDHFWLSDTPALPGSMTWGNRYPRMVTWVRFRDIATQREFVFVNTHFDHEVQESRERSASLLLERLANVPATTPVILAGDFNAPAGRNPVYDMLVGAGGFRDAWQAAGPADSLGTFHGFEGLPAARGKGRIDWILLRGPVEALHSAILTEAPGGQLPSDHFPVVARLRLNQASDG